MEGKTKLWEKMHPICFDTKMVDFCMIFRCKLYSLLAAAIVCVPFVLLTLIENLRALDRERVNDIFVGAELSLSRSSALFELFVDSNDGK